MRKLLIVASTLAIVLTATSAFAQPKGLKADPEVGRKLWSFNVLVKPHGWVDTGNACNGARIFFDEEPNGGGVSDTITWVLDPDAPQDFQITDCNGTDGAASVKVDENQGNVIVAIRLVGPKTSTLRFTCEVLLNAILTAGEELCVQDEFNLDRNHKAFTKVMKNIVDNELENVLWTFDSTRTWKIFQVRVYEYIYPAP
jgi:hypothetical protein